jgi:uncharacterized membrane protein (UPF0182 family)
MTSRRGLALVLIAGAVALVVAHGAARAYEDYRWYRAMGAVSIWNARLMSLSVLRLLGGLAIGLFAFANFYAVRRSVVSLVLPRRLANLDFGEEVPSRALTGMALLLAILVGAALAMSLHDWWGFILARTGHPFGETDPFLDVDLGFFTYRLPFERVLLGWATTSVLSVAAVVVFLYLLTPGLRLERRRLHVSEYIRRHLTVLVGVLLLLLAWHFRLGMYSLLLHGTSGSATFGAVDHRIRIPGELVLAMITLAAGLVVVWAGWTGQRRLVVTALVGVVLTAVTARGAAPWLGGRFLDAPERGDSEQPYRVTRAGYTRRAYAVDQIAMHDTTVAFRSLADAAAGIPVWDGEALARAVEAESRLDQAARVAWGSGPDGIVGVVTSPQPPPDPGEAAPMGIAIRTVASAADPRGAPVRLVTPGTDDGAALLAPSVILDTDPGYIVVPDSAGRVRGIPLSSPLERVAAGLSIRNLRLWTPELPGPRPVLVTIRNARRRVRALVPFFTQGSQVSPLVTGDSLYWVIELYASANTYPLADPIVLAGATRTYFHHAGTALVLSSTGAVQFVMDGAPGPIAATWLARFPSIFATGREVPATVLSQLPPALDQARAQALAFGRYGARTGGGVPSQPPLVDGADSTLAGSYPVVALPGGGPTAFEIPLLDAVGRVRGLMVAAGGAGHRTVWHAIDDSMPPRWNLILDRLADPDTGRPPATSSADESTPSLVHGVVRAVAVRHTAVYVQSIYQWIPGAAPRLHQVAYFVDGKAHRAPSLRQAVGRPAPAHPDLSGLGPEPRDAMRRLYAAMRDALRRGDWTAFGKAFDALGELLARPPE